MAAGVLTGVTAGGVARGVAVVVGDVRLGEYVSGEGDVELMGGVAGLTSVAAEVAAGGGGDGGLGGGGGWLPDTSSP